MFSFFRKKEKIRDQAIAITNSDRTFLEKLITALQFKYPNLIHQLEPGFIVLKYPTTGGRNGSFTFGTDEELHKKYRDKAKGYFTIRNIRARVLDSERKPEVEIRISEDLLVGYYCAIDIAELDPDSLDLSNMYEKHFVNEDLNVVREKFGEFSKKELESLDIGTTFRIDLEGGPFYTIKDLEDGNYLAVNEKGEVFGLIHDPFEVEKLYPSLAPFINELNSGRFSFDTYLDKKLS